MPVSMAIVYGPADAALYSHTGISRAAEHGKSNYELSAIASPLSSASSTHHRRVTTDVKYARDASECKRYSTDGGPCMCARKETIAKSYDRPMLDRSTSLFDSDP